jgi:hypothetical protein
MELVARVDRTVRAFEVEGKRVECALLVLAEGTKHRNI